jgi:phosphonate transport system substrate-binding protein
MLLDVRVTKKFITKLHYSNLKEELTMFILKRMALLCIAAVLTISIGLVSVAGADWREQFKEVKIGILSGENERDRIQRYTPFAKYMTKVLGVPVKIFTASSYAGVMQAMAADQIEFAFYGSSSYAGAWVEMKGNVVPLLTRVMDNGSTGYFSVVVVRSDSPYKNLDDLKGKTLAFADPNSTSGYAVPYYNLKNWVTIRKSFSARSLFPGPMKPACLVSTMDSTTPRQQISSRKRPVILSAWPKKA